MLHINVNTCCVVFFYSLPFGEMKVYNTYFWKWKDTLTGSQRPLDRWYVTAVSWIVLI
jgi:hypothetical protein